MTVIKFLIIFIFVMFLIKKVFQSCSGRTGFTPMHDAFVALRLLTIFLISSLYVMSHSIASTSDITFLWALQTQTEWVIFGPAKTHHLGLKGQNFQNPIFTFGPFTLKAVYNSCKLQLLFQVYSYSLVFLFRQLPTKIVVVIVFPFLGAGFHNISPTLLISCKV